MAKIKRGKNQNEGKNRQLPNVFNKKQILDLFGVIYETDIFMACLIALFCGLRIVGMTIILFFPDLAIFFVIANFCMFSL